MSATGYAEIVDHLRGDVPLDEAADRIRRRTRGYARRQLTWFRNQLPARAVRLDATRDLDDLVEEGINEWSS
jgi:tRNA dimethylallyltransferase